MAQVSKDSHSIIVGAGVFGLSRCANHSASFFTIHWYILTVHYGSRNPATLQSQFSTNNHTSRTHTAMERMEHQQTSTRSFDSVTGRRLNINVSLSKLLIFGMSGTKSFQNFNRVGMMLDYHQVWKLVIRCGLIVGCWEWVLLILMGNLRRRRWRVWRENLGWERNNLSVGTRKVRKNFCVVKVWPLIP